LRHSERIHLLGHFASWSLLESIDLPSMGGHVRQPEKGELNDRLVLGLASYAQDLPKQLRSSGVVGWRIRCPGHIRPNATIVTRLLAVALTREDAAKVPTGVRIGFKASRIGEAGSTPSNLWSGDEEARQVVEQLNRDAGYEPVYAGPLENAAAQENVLKVVIAISQGGMGPFFYRIAPPDQL
jgi:hypothetical protein